MLRRPLTAAEQSVRAKVQIALEQRAQVAMTSGLSRELAASGGLLFFAAAMSLIDMPPSNPIQRRLCAYLIAAPGFLAYLGNPDRFTRPDLVEICRVLMEMMPRLDVEFVNMLSVWKEELGDMHNPTFLRILDVLDELSPGGRLVMSLTRLMRDLDPTLESKAALSLGRRVQNPAAVARQLISADSRVRANCIESLWGIATPVVMKLYREHVADTDNRVVGNALIGLWLAGAPDAKPRLFQMIKDKSPDFRQTAAWAMGKTADPIFRAPLTLALSDSDTKVRAAAATALARFPQNPAPLASNPESAAPTDTRDPDAAPEENLDLCLDGSFPLARRQ